MNYSTHHAVCRISSESTVEGSTRKVSNIRKYKIIQREKDTLTINLLGRDFLLTYSVVTGKEDRHVSVSISIIKSTGLMLGVCWVCFLGHLHHEIRESWIQGVLLCDVGVGTVLSCPGVDVCIVVTV